MPIINEFQITALIVDDEQSARDNVRYLMNRFCPKVQVIGEASNVDNAIRLIEKLQPVLVFLDIEMPQKNGFQLIYHFETIDFAVIFITAYDEFAIKAFEVSAVDYLLKPIDTDRLQLAVEKVIQQQQTIQNLELLKQNLQSNTPKKMAIPYKGDAIIINISDISCIEAQRMYSEIYVGDNQYLYTQRLSYFEKTLNEQDFMRVHRSWLVNMSQVSSYSRKDHNLELKSGKKIPVSKSYKKEVEDYFI